MADQDLYELEVSMLVSSVVCSFQVGYRQDGGANGPETLTKAVNKFILSFLDVLQLAVATAVEFDQVRMDPVTATDELPGFFNMNNVLGNVAGDPMPANVAAIISRQTNAPNSKHNGRIYIPGISEEGQAEGQMTAGQTTLVQDFATVLLVPLVPDAPETATFEPVIISRVLNGAPRVPPVGFQIISEVAKNDLRQQRRRTTKRLGLST